MYYPTIKNLDEVKTILKDTGKTEFSVYEKSHYIVVNYNFAEPNTFEHEDKHVRAVLRECRGIMFDLKGDIISRPYHKFFNINEKEYTKAEVLNVANTHLILDKLDGSMIRPIYQKEYDSFRLGTKQGLSDVSFEAEVHFFQHRNYIDFGLWCCRKNLTPIFEWCSKDRNIVIKHEKDHVILTAIRDNESGVYIDYEEMFNYADKYNILVVSAYGTLDSVEKFLKEKVTDASGIEGYIIRYDDGSMYKAKTSEYVKLHKSKEIIESEHNVIRLILENNIDDVKSHLVGKDREYVENLELNVWGYIDKKSSMYKDKFNEIKQSGISRKDFALSQDIDQTTKQAILCLWSEKDIRENMIRNLFSSCKTKKSYESIKGKINA